MTTIKLRINFKDLYNDQEITSHTMDRTVVKKGESDYGIFYYLKCGWYVDYNYQYKRWEITTLKKGEFVGRFAKEDIVEIKK